MAEEGKGIATAILGVVAIIAVIGLILLFKGSAGKVIADPVQRACGIISCTNGEGAVVLGETGDGEFWVCGCSAQFQDATIADWSNQWKGDEARGGGIYNYESGQWLVRKIREY